MSFVLAPWYHMYVEDHYENEEKKGAKGEGMKGECMKERRMGMKGERVKELITRF